jgi:uncharacterized protein with HEPN domain
MLKPFARTSKPLFAVQHALLIISEAAAKLGTLATALCPTVPWRDIRGLGNRLRHEYSTVDVVRLWTTIERDLVPLKAAAQAALQELLAREE